VGLRSETALAPAKAKDSRPICVTRLFLNPLLKGIDAKLRERKTAVYALIEREYKVNIQRVEQELQSVALDADDAANLGTSAGSPALLVLRRYYDDRDQLLEVAENIHPGDRFTYRMQLRK
jgi:DNA-binding GntR family transcriptional regulator